LAETVPPPIIHINPAEPKARRLWSLALEIAEAVGPDGEWSLIGGLMVQLHGFEHNDGLRPTVDIDILAAARKPPAMTEEIASLLTRRGAQVAMPPRSNPALGYRFELHGEVIEILGPDGLKTDPKTVGGLTTFQASGGTKEPRRTEIVPVSLDGSPPVAIRRPNLLGAILIKARVVAERRKEKFDSDRQDLIRLLSYVDDPRALAREEQLKRSEKRWLRKIEGALAFDPSPAANPFPAKELFPSIALKRAEQSFRLLCA